MATGEFTTSHVIDTMTAPLAKGKDFISCHVLDTLTGRPAQGITAYLICTKLERKSLVQNRFVGRTDNDGRITAWENMVEGYPESLEEVLSAGQDGVFTPSVWKLIFLTGEYYGEGKTFWPEVELNFYVKAAEHYHVPLLLGPYSYTTYRGS